MRRGPARSCGPRPPHTLQTAFTTAVTLSPPLPPRCVASVPGVSRRHTRSLFHPLPLYARPPLHCWLVRRQPALPHPPRAPTRPRASVCASRGRRLWPAAPLVGATARGRHGSRSPDTPPTYRYPCVPQLLLRWWVLESPPLSHPPPSRAFLSRPTHPLSLPVSPPFPASPRLPLPTRRGRWVRAGWVDAHPLSPVAGPSRCPSHTPIPGPAGGQLGRGRGARRGGGADKAARTTRRAAAAAAARAVARE